MIRNVHERVLAADAGPLIDRIQEVWPTSKWPPIVLDRPLGVGADGGHGPIRYRCTAYEPGRMVEFTFSPAMGMNGTHRLEADGNVLRHTLIGHPAFATRIRWAVAIRWLHDACLEDLLDNAETALGTPPAKPARWSPWVRLLRWTIRRRQPARVPAT